MWGGGVVALEQGCAPMRGSLCFVSDLTLREDQMEMVVVRNKVLVTFEASFHIHPLCFSPLFLTSHQLAAPLCTSPSFCFSI